MKLNADTPNTRRASQAELAKSKGKEGDPVKRREADAAALQAKIAAKAAAAAAAPK